RPALAELVDADEGAVPGPAGGHVAVEAVPGQVRLGAAEPPEGGRRPVKDTVPLLEPGQPLRLSGPEPVRVAPGFLLHAAHHWVHDVHGSPFAAVRLRLRTIDVIIQAPAPNAAPAAARAASRPRSAPPPDLDTDHPAAR